MTAWQDLFVPDLVLRSLAEQGFTSPTPIQTLTLTAAIRDRLDIVGAAETVGSSKDHQLKLWTFLVKVFGDIRHGGDLCALMYIS